MDSFISAFAALDFVFEYTNCFDDCANIAPKVIDHFLLNFRVYWRAFYYPSQALLMLCLEGLISMDGQDLI